MISKPVKAFNAKNGAVGYKFDIKDFPNGESDGQYYVRGAVCWPILDVVTSRSQGWALLAGQNIKTKNIVVFESTPFSHISNMIEDDKLISMGLVDWFRSVWQKYYCDSFFWSGQFATHQQYLLEVIRCVDINPQPHFIEVHITDEDDAVNLMYHMRTKDALIIETDPDRKDGKTLINQLLLWEQTERKHEFPAVKALLSLTSGYARYPFRPSIDEEEVMPIL